MGGQRWVLGNCEDVWELTLSGSAWSKVSTAGVCPALRAGHSAVYCPDLGGVLVFGGRQPLMVLPPVMNDLWLLSTEGAATWQELRPRSVERPCGLEGHAAIYDSVHRRMLVLGGGAFLGPCDGIRPSCWSFSIPDLAWSRLSYPGPVPHGRVYASAVVDPSRGRVL